ncbi:MAG: nickel-dependent lactate racemase [Acidaminococcales bacterium]|jgi:nickel-dependent lactate racemase|nr:nickel-dependent lactate racemase [Acidaminococcales bacterium]
MPKTKNFRFKYGNSYIDFAVPQDRLLGELKTAPLPVLPDPVGAVRRALDEPIDAPPLSAILKPGKTVSLLVNDTTRVANTHVFMPVLLDIINAAGIPDENISLIFALGTHRAMSGEEMARVAGRDAARRLKKYNPDCKDRSQYVYLGDTSFGTPVWLYKKMAESDYIICTGSIVHHFFAGFGGGRKAVFPGAAYYESIQKNHALMLRPGAAIGRLEGNPVYEDQMEAAKKCPPAFLLNVVLNENKEFLGVFAGNYITAHRKACQMVDQAYGVEIPAPADLVIATCGGYPKDINVYQLQKTMDNAHCAVRDGGAVIIFGECAEGSGSETYEKLMERCPTPEAVEEDIRRDFQIGAHKAFSVTRLMKKAAFILISGLPPELARKLLFTPAASFGQAMDIAKSIVGEHPSIYLMPQGSLTVPRVRQ